MIKQISFSFLTLSASIASAAVVVDFEDQTLAPNSFYNGGPVTNSNGWSSGGVSFRNRYDSRFGGFWSGFSYSNVQNNTTPGFTNQYAAYTGSGFGGSGNYAIAFPTASFNLPDGTSPGSVRITNTTYAAFDLQTGSSFSKKFGGITGNDPDFFTVTFTGYNAVNATGQTTGTPVTFTLADYRFANNAQDYIVNTWQLLDLTPLGDARSVRLTWASSDVGQFGINTPTYVALDNLTLVPEPAAISLLAMGAAMLLRRRSRAQI
jgi:hypothetical protein